MKRKLAVLSIVVLSLLSITVIQAGAAITPGTKCSKAGLQSVYKSKIYTCIKLGSQLFWDNGVTFYLSKPSPSPAPTVTVTATPSPAPTVTITASPVPAPTVTVTAKPSPAPTVTVTASPRAIPMSLPAVTSFNASIGGSFISFSFDKPVTSSKITNYELAAQYLLNPNSAMNSYSSYSELKVIRSIYSTSFDVWLSEIREFLDGNEIWTKNRSVMFRLRAINNDVSTSPWSKGLYFTPSQIWGSVTATPMPTPTPTKTITPTPTPTPTISPTLITGRFFSGSSVDNSDWKWVAVEIKNSSQSNILSHRFYDVLIGDSAGAIVDSTFEPGFPQLLPSQSGWYVTTQFNNKSSSQVVFRKTGSTSLSPFTAAEFPSVLNPRLVTSPYISSRKAVGFTLKNNSSSQILGSASKAFAVVLNASGQPVYAASGFIGKSILPGGQAEVTIDDFTFNGDYSSIQVTIGILTS
jgi:hypothetical protein